MKALTNRDAVTMYQALEQAGTVPASVQFAFWVATNKRRLKPVVESIEDASKAPAGEAADYDAARAELARKHMDPDGPNPATTGGRVRVDRKAFDADVALLDKQFPNAKRLLMAHAEKVEKLMDAAVPDPPPVLAKVALSEVPTAGLSGNVLDVLYDYITQPEEPKPAPAAEPRGPNVRPLTD